MGLVDGEQADFCPLDLCDEGLAHKALRGHIEELEFSRCQILVERSRFGRSQGGIEPCRRNTAFLQHIDLVFHEGDQWRHDQGDSLHENRRELVAKRLATASRKDSQRRAPSQQGLDNLPLAFSESVVAEVFPKCGFKVAMCGFHRASN